MEKYTVEEVMELVFTTENKSTGSQPPANIGWVIFENGTVFLISKNDLPLDASIEEFSKLAIEGMKEQGTAVAGTPSGDFSESLLEGWYPDEFVYFVTYDHPKIANISIVEEESNGISVGFFSRANRDEDIRNLKIRSVRHFDKTLTVF